MADVEDSFQLRRSPRKGFHRLQKGPRSLAASQSIRPHSARACLNVRSRYLSERPGLPAVYPAPAVRHCWRLAWRPAPCPRSASRAEVHFMAATRLDAIGNNMFAKRRTAVSLEEDEDSGDGREEQRAPGEFPPCIRRVFLHVAGPPVSFLASEPCPGPQSLKSLMAKNSFRACETATGSSCCSQWLASGSSVSWPFGQ